MKILVVDDEEMIVDVAVLMLKHYKKIKDADIFTARDGFDGIEEIKKHNPDIVITDYMMPKRNGIEVARYVQNGNYKAKVFLMTGGRLTKEEEAVIRSVGISNFLYKPFQSDDLCNLIK